MHTGYLDVKSGTDQNILVLCTQPLSLTALTSPKLPFLAKCALRLALALPAQTPQRLRMMLLKLKTATRTGLGNAGDIQSRTMAASLRMSAARRYFLHSGSSAVPSRWAKRIVAIRPIDS